ncbi:MAG TPA: hypothetical protein VHN99_10220 [Deinococcales bacterium]|nr:hypothetical protein [Deinococcales bacterium]
MSQPENKPRRPLPARPPLPKRSAVPDRLLFANAGSALLVLLATLLAAGRTRTNPLDYLIIALSAYAAFTFLNALRLGPDADVRGAWPPTLTYALVVAAFAVIIGAQALRP